MAKAPKLKVFQAHFGFFDTIVAVPSQAAALRAWGVHRNIFADGQAKLTTDEAAVAAATAHPEIVLKRPVGSNGPFEVEPTSLPKLPDVPAKKATPKAKEPAAHKAPAPPPPPPPDRSFLSKAEAALRAVDEQQRAEEAAFRERQAALDAEKLAAQGSYAEARRAAAAQVAKALQAYRKAGGQE
ncbi:MAG: cell envelope biogenesis protein TolA [Pseudomonadota bacterium]